MAQVQARFRKLKKRRLNSTQRQLNKIHNSFSTTSIIDRQLLRQKVRQKISVIKTNTFVFCVFKTKRESKCQNELFL